MEAPATHPHLGLLLPLCTSSASIGLSLFQYPIFFSFTRQPESLAAINLAGRPFSQFWKTFLPGAVTFIVSNCFVSTVSGVLAWRWLKYHGLLETGEVADWFLWGSILSAGHVAFIPLVMGPIQKIISGVDDAGKSEAASDTHVQEKNKKELDNWFLWHTVRTLTVDFGAVWCFAKGIELALWVV